jgi:osmoprotectant transport system ATP-binding protein
MKDGNIVQFDTPEEILKNPEQDFVEEFVGKNRIWNNPEFIKVSDIMIENPVKANGSRTIVQAIEIMKNHSVDSLLITDKDKKLIGIVTAKDIRRNIDKKVTLQEIMGEEVITAHMSASIIDVLAIMNEKNVGYVPVVDDGNILKGLITKSSLISILSTQFLDMEVEI